MGQRRPQAVFAAGAREQPAAPPVGAVGAFLRGWGAAVGAPGVVLLLWLGNVAFAAAATLPVAAAIEAHVGHSAAGEHQFARVSLDAVAEFVFAHEAELRTAAVAFLPIAAAYALLSLYLTGGVLERLWDGQRSPWSQFFAACNRRVVPLLVIGLLTLALGTALVWPAQAALSALVARYTENAAGPEVPFVATWIHWGVLLFLGSWIGRVYDYARAALVMGGARGPVGAFFRGLSFTLRRGTRTFVLWLLLRLPPVVLLAAYVDAAGRYAIDTTSALLVTVVAGQVLLMVRFAGRLAALAGQMRFLGFHGG